MAAYEGYEKSAHLYDLFDDKDNIGLFLKYAAGVAEVMDIGAGTGRIAIPLARAGSVVTCVEPSPAMRREFELKLAAEPEIAARVKMVAGTCAGFDLGRTFPLAVLSGCFDHFLDDGERLASLGNVARHLEKGGRLILDSFLGLMGDSPLKPARSRTGSRSSRWWASPRAVTSSRFWARPVSGFMGNSVIITSLPMRGSDF